MVEGDPAAQLLAAVLLCLGVEAPEPGAVGEAEGAHHARGIHREDVAAGDDRLGGELAAVACPFADRGAPDELERRARGEGAHMVLRIAPDLRPIRVEKRRRQDDRAGVGGVHGEIAHGRQHVEPLARQRRFRRAEPVAAAGESERRQQRGPPRERAAAEAAGPARCLVAHSERRAKSAAARPRTPCGALGSPLRSVRVFSAAFLSPRAISISNSASSAIGRHGLPAASSG